MSRWLLLACDFPWPTWHGSRLEVHNRLLAAARAEVSVDLIATVKERPLPEHMEHVQSMCGQVWVEPRRRPLGAALRVLQPYQIASRRVSPATVEAVIHSHTVRPYDVVLVDGLFTVDIGRDLALRLGVPLVLRSHNVESRYFAGQAATARTRLLAGAYRVEELRLKRLERSKTLNESLKVNINIAPEDQDVHGQAMTCRQTYLPPFLPSAQMIETAVAPPPSRDVLFVGSLGLAQAQGAVQWFLNEVWPRILERRPDARFVIVGRGIQRSIAEAWAKQPSVQVIGEVSDVRPWYEAARVVVNPTRHGSGVNMKNLEAFSFGRPLVTTTFGARGFSWRDPMEIAIADDPGKFANFVVDLVGDDLHWSRRVAASRRFAAEELDPDRAMTRLRAELDRVQTCRGTATSSSSLAASAPAGFQ